MAIIRLAALFENDKWFGSLLASATEVERQGIAYIRGVVSDPGQMSLGDDVFWATTTRQVPMSIAKLREANGL